jgi:hypothetical protein
VGGDVAVNAREDVTTVGAGCLNEEGNTGDALMGFFHVTKNLRFSAQ